MTDWVGTMNGAKAPSAGAAGTGRGNVPFAPGIMSGNMGQRPAPLARNSSGGPNTASSVPQGQPPPAAPPPGQMPGGVAGPPGTMLDPQVWFTMLNAYMNALMESTKTPIIPGIY